MLLRGLKTEIAIMSMAKGDKKYLLYDNIVRGAGIGHSLCCINYAMQLSLKNKLQLLLGKVIITHGMNGCHQKLFGFPDYSRAWEKISQDSPELAEFVPCDPPTALASSDFTLTKKSFLYLFNQNEPNVEWKNLLDHQLLLRKI